MKFVVLGLLSLASALTVTVTIQPKGTRKVVNPEIYGVNFADYSQTAIPFGSSRLGGNAETAYNYLADASNQGSDWYFLTEAQGDGTNLPSQNQQNKAIRAALAKNKNILVTVPLTGWVAASRTKAPSFPVSKFGQQQCTEYDYAAAIGANPNWGDPNAGNGRVKVAGQTCNPWAQSGNWITNQVAAMNSCQAIDTPWVTQWVQQLRTTHGAGKVKYFSMDNEPMLWDSTHHDKHPAKVTYDDLWNRTLFYSNAVKAAESAAKVFGPVTWGFCDLYWSAADGCNDGTNPDRTAHGGVHWLEWYISQISKVYTQTGKKVVDYIDLHWYPQGSDSSGGIYGADGDATLQAMRLRSIKELFDSTYIPENWIKDVKNAPIKLIPTVKGFISASANASWLKVALTEFNWGSGYTGQLAHAEILSIFANQGLDFATQWGYNDDGSNRAGDAYKIYLNYDGAGSQVLGDNIPVSSTSFDDVSGYGYANHGNSKLWVLLFNKNTGAVTVSGKITGTTTTAQSALHYYFDASHALTKGSSVSVSSSGTFSVSLGARSAHLLVLTGVANEEVTSGGMGTTYTIAISVGVVAAVLLLALLVFFFINSRKHRRESVTSSEVVALGKDETAVQLDSTTTTTTTTAPASAAAVTETPSPSGWETRTDADSGKPYYYNNSTGASQWEAPEI